ncbi:MAG: 5-carboxymethyl-2-hydroxymuconate Delta-isomerase [Pseudomonadota bacterium]
MPHFIVEYSSNLEGHHDLRALSDLIAKTAIDTGVFPLGGIRVRLYPSEIYTIADGHPENGFVSILVRMGAGRTEEVKKAAGQAVFDAVAGFFSHALEGGYFMLSLDVQENEAAFSFKKNGVHGRLKRQ